MSGRQKDEDTPRKLVNEALLSGIGDILVIALIVGIFVPRWQSLTTGQVVTFYVLMAVYVAVNIVLARRWSRRAREFDES